VRKFHGDFVLCDSREVESAKGNTVLYVSISELADVNKRYDVGTV
jgi:hypothetical protein